MKILIAILLLSSVCFANMVELEFPEFSKKVREQAKKDRTNPDEVCSVDTTRGEQNAELTCGTGEKKVVNKNKLGNLGDENSQYAQDKVQENSKSR